MPKIFQICQEFPRALRGFPILIFYHFFHNSSTRNAKNSIKLSKTSYYSLECIWISRGFAPLILLDSRTPMGHWRHRVFSETCQNNMWFCKDCQKGRNSTAKSFFFSLNYNSFPILTEFEQLSSSISLASYGHLEKGCFPTQTGVCGCWNFHQFLVFCP